MENEENLRRHQRRESKAACYLNVLAWTQIILYFSVMVALVWFYVLETYYPSTSFLGRIGLGIIVMAWTLLVYPFPLILNQPFVFYGCEIYLIASFFVILPLGFIFGTFMSFLLIKGVRQKSLSVLKTWSRYALTSIVLYILYICGMFSWFLVTLLSHDGTDTYIQFTLSVFQSLVPIVTFYCALRAVSIIKRSQTERVEYVHQMTDILNPSAENEARTQ